MVSAQATPDKPQRESNAIALPEGFVLKEYTIESVLGTGGFGITYLAYDNHLQCKVAIKEYLPSELATRTPDHHVVPRTSNDADSYQEGLARFLSETRVLAGFRHPHIVRVNRFFETNNTAYMVMDYEQGQSLRDWVKVHGPADKNQLRRMFLGLLDGMELMHKAGTIHRDIKPHNIYVRDSDSSLVLLDFGAARQSTSQVSRSMTSMVTPGYAPFEQYHSHGEQGPWSDLYALGGVLYWLVTGHKPMEAPARVKEDCMPAASEVAVGRYSEGFLRMIDWAMSMDERERPQSVAEFRPVFLGKKRAPEPAPKAVTVRNGRDGDTVPIRSSSRTVRKKHSAAGVEPAQPKTQANKPSMALVLIGLAVAVAVVLFALVRLNKSSPSAPEAAQAGTAPAAAVSTPTSVPENPVAAPANTAPAAPTAAPAQPRPATPEKATAPKTTVATPPPTTAHRDKPAAPAPQASETPKPVEPAPSTHPAARDFGCKELPFGLMVTCGVEGKDVVRKCAPDLKNWNHDIPGCDRRREVRKAEQF